MLWSNDGPRILTNPLLKALLGATRVAYFQSVTSYPVPFTAMPRESSLDIRKSVLTGADDRKRLLQPSFDSGPVRYSFGLPTIKPRPRAQSSAFNADALYFAATIS
jgi:hypothetical protein